MENIKQIIEEVEGFERELEDVDPGYYEKDFIDGASETFLVMPVKGVEVEVYFPEYEDVKEIKNAIYKGEKTENDLIEDLSNRNDLDEQFDFGKVVAYRIYGGTIEWL